MTWFTGNVQAQSQYRQWILFGRTSYVVAARELLSPSHISYLSGQQSVDHFVFQLSKPLSLSLVWLNFCVCSVKSAILSIFSMLFNSSILSIFPTFHRYICILSTLHFWSIWSILSNYFILSVWVNIINFFVDICRFSSY